MPERMGIEGFLLSELMMKKYFALFLVMLSLAASVWAAGTTHVIVYASRYRAQAQALADICKYRWGIETVIMDYKNLYLNPTGLGFDYELGFSLGRINSEDSDWQRCWNLTARLNRHDPRRVLGGHNFDGTIDSITILGNHLEIPPSMVAENSIALSVGGEVGSDFYYGVPFDVGVTSYIPSAGVSRLPVTVLYPNTQSATMSVSSSGNAYFEVQHTQNNSDLFVPGYDFSADVAFYTNDNPSVYLGTYPVYYPTTHVAALGGGRYKISISDYSYEGGTLADPINFPYLVQNTPKTQGSYALQGTPFTGPGDVIEIYNPYKFGGRTALLQDPLATFETISAVTKILNYNGDGQLVIDSANLHLRRYTEAAFQTGVTDKTISAFLIIDEGALKDNIYAVNSLSSNILTVSSTVGDFIYDPGASAKFTIYDGTAMKSYLNSLGNITGVQIIRPTFNYIGIKASIASEVNIYNLVASADNIVAKAQAYNTFLWQTDKKLDSAQKALVIATAEGSFWDYSTEHVALEVINGQDSTDTGIISIMDGFKIDKVFGSKPLTDKYSFQNRLINEAWGRGVLLGLENWQDFFARTNKVHTTNLAFAPSAGASGNQELPFLIGTGRGGAFLDYSSASVSSRLVGLAEYLLTSPIVAIGGSYTGIMGYIGPINSGLAVDEGRWNRGYFSPVQPARQKLWNRDFLTREAMKQYTTAAQPVLSSIWRESLLQLLKARVNESELDNIKTIEQAAVDLAREMEQWGMQGIAAQPLPLHQTFPRSGGFPGDVPKPEIALDVTALRAANPYDRFETPVLEIPNKVDRSGNVSIKFSITNLRDKFDGYNNLISKGLFDYDPNMKFKFTLVSVPLERFSTTLGVNAYNSIPELHPMNGGSGQPDTTDICYVTEIAAPLYTMTYNFYEHWTNGGASGNLKRGPGYYMLRVEAQEKDRSTNTGLYPCQKPAQYTKEARIFFKVTNAFTPETAASILLINNTDHNPYKQVGPIANYVPNAAIRYYEDALDNYQYTTGTLTVKNDSVGVDKVLLASDNVAVTFWTDRVVVGDKIRVQDSDGVFTPWLRISDLTKGGNNIIVEDPTKKLSTLNKFNKSKYLIQRAYTSGYASIAYTSVGPSANVEMSNQVTLTIPNEEYLMAQENKIIRAGDFFKLCDGRAYVKIAAVGTPTFGASTTSVLLTLTGKYPHENILTYYGDYSGYSYTSWEATRRISTGSDLIVNGSYAIYPPDPANSEKARYLYQTWNVHNYVTSNFPGMGLHGDVSANALEAFSTGDTLGHRHKLIIVANDAGYGIPPPPYPNSRNRNLTDALLTEIYSGRDYFYFSSTDKNYFDAYLNKGGRIMTGGQFASPLDHTFFKQSLGINGVTISAETAIKKVEGDIVSNEFNNQLSIQDGFAEGSTNSVVKESLKTNLSPKKLTLVEGQAKPIFHYVATDALSSSPAAIRASGGDDYQPYAAIYLGFDFADISVSGVLNGFSDLTMQGSEKGRNFFIKKSVDWLRDPTRTSDAERVKVDYHALNRDGTSTVIGLKQGDKINDNIHFLNQTASQLTGVGPNQKIILSASGGKLYGYTMYQWSFVGAGNLVVDSAAPNNSDQHQVIFTTGPNTNVTYTLKLRSPDGEELQIDVVTHEQPLIVYAPNINADVLLSPIVDNNISVSTIIGGAGNVRFRAIGGDGIGSYSFFLVNDNSVFTSNPTQRLKLEDSQTIQYYMPDGASLSIKKNVNIQVKSGSTTATASITVYPKLSIQPTPQQYVVGGTEPRFEVSGGKPTNSAGDVIGYTFTGSTALTVMADANGLKATAKAASGTEGSTNPLLPATYNVVATDKNFTTASITGQVNMFAAPWIRQFVMGTTGNTFVDVVSGKTFDMSSSGYLYFAITGGNGTTQITVNDSTGGVANLDLTKDILNIDPFNQIASVVRESISTTESIVMNYVSGNIFSIATGTTNGSITLTLTSGGSSKNTVLNFSSPLIVNVAKGNGVLGNYDGVNIGLRAYNSGQSSGANTLLQVASVSGTAPFAWSMSPANLGSFISATDYSAYYGNLAPPVVLPSPQTQASFSEQVYFIAGSLNQSGFLSVTDANGQTATIAISISGVDPMSWTSETGTKAQTSYFRSRLSYSFTGGSAPYTISLPSGLTATLKITGSKTATPAAGVPLTMTTADGKNGVFNFDLTGTGVAGEGRITVTDKNGLTLQSSIVKFTASSSSGTTTVVQGPPVVSATLPGSGGGGCLLE